MSASHLEHVTKISDFSLEISHFGIVRIDFSHHLSLHLAGSFQKLQGIE